MHHSGTGVTREAVFESLRGNKMASHSETGMPEDECEHLQSIFPADYLCEYNSTFCGKKSFLSREVINYYCPPLVKLAQNLHNKMQLFEEWSEYWMSCF